MKTLPATENVPAVRTDYEHEAAWEAVRQAIHRRYGPFRAYVDFISDPALAGFDADQLRAMLPPGFSHPILLIVDRLALAGADHPVLVVDLEAEPGRTFRVIPSEIWGVENNLSLANMDFWEFADHAGPDGVFRGFPRS